MEQPLRLVKFIAASGAASRRGAAELVRTGRVSVNGLPAASPGMPISSGDEVRLDGKLLQIAERRRYIMLHKPRGYVCTNADPHAGLKAIDLIRLDPPVRLFSAGRLDKESEGLILFSDDGDFVAELTHPRYEILKTYHVETARRLTEEELARIRNGIVDEGERLTVRSIRPLGGRKYEIILNEGKKREIRRLTAAMGAPTRRLRRLKIGSLELGELPVGRWRELSPEEVALARTPEPRQLPPCPPPRS